MNCQKMYLADATVLYLASYYFYGSVQNRFLPEPELKLYFQLLLVFGTQQFCHRFNFQIVCDMCSKLPGSACCVFQPANECSA